MRKAMRINCSTYGWFNPDTSVFECTHGAWSGVVEFIDDTTCTISTVSGVCTYRYINAIPAEYS